MTLLQLYPTYETYLDATFTKIRATGADALFPREVPIWAQDDNAYYSSRLIYNAFISEYGNHTLNFAQDRFEQKFLMQHIDMLPTLYARTAALNNVFLNTFNTEEIIKTVTQAFYDDPDNNYQEVISGDRSSNVKGLVVGDDEVYRQANVTRSVDKSRSISEFKNLLTRLQELNNVAIDGEILDFIKGAEFASLFTYDPDALLVDEENSFKMDIDMSNRIQEAFEEAIRSSVAYAELAQVDLSNVIDSVFSTKWFSSLAGTNTSDRITDESIASNARDRAIQREMDALYEALSTVNIDTDILLTFVENPDGTADATIDLSQFDLTNVTDDQNIVFYIDHRNDDGDDFIHEVVYDNFNSTPDTPNEFFGDNVLVHSDANELVIRNVNPLNWDEKYLVNIKSSGGGGATVVVPESNSSHIDLTNMNRDEIIALGLQVGDFVMFKNPNRLSSTAYGWVTRIIVQEHDGTGGQPPVDNPVTDYVYTLDLKDSWELDTFEFSPSAQTLTYNTISSLATTQLDGGFQDDETVDNSVWGVISTITKSNLVLNTDDRITGSIIFDAIQEYENLGHENNPDYIHQPFQMTLIWDDNAYQMSCNWVGQFYELWENDTNTRDSVTGSGVQEFAQLLVQNTTIPPQYRVESVNRFGSSDTTKYYWKNRHVAFPEDTLLRERGGDNDWTYTVNGVDGGNQRPEWVIRNNTGRVIHAKFNWIVTTISRSVADTFWSFQKNVTGTSTANRIREFRSGGATGAYDDMTFNSPEVLVQPGDTFRIIANGSTIEAHSLTVGNSDNSIFIEYEFPDEVTTNTNTKVGN